MRAVVIHIRLDMSANVSLACISWLRIESDVSIHLDSTRNCELVIIDGHAKEPSPLICCKLVSALKPVGAHLRRSITAKMKNLVQALFISRAT
jgi:hypothetical protein